MSTRFALVAGALLASIAAAPLSAQQSTGSAMRDTSGAKKPAASSASSDSALVDLGRAITALMVSVQTVVEETAKNPEMRRAALQTAGLAVNVAQRALEENKSEIERLLAEASRRIADVEAKEKAKPATPATPKSH